MAYMIFFNVEAYIKPLQSGYSFLNALNLKKNKKKGRVIKKNPMKRKIFFAEAKDLKLKILEIS